MDAQQHKADLKEFRDHIQHIKIAALITLSASNTLRGRPMSTAEVDEDGNLWFFTNEYTEKVDEIEHHHEVLLSYNNPSDNLYVMVNGLAQLVDNKAKMEALWNPALKLWFPDGLKDERLKLLKVQPHEVEYWNANSSKIERVFKIVKALIKGDEFKDEDHKKVTIS